MVAARHGIRFCVRPLFTLGHSGFDRLTARALKAAPLIKPHAGDLALLDTDEAKEPV